MHYPNLVIINGDSDVSIQFERAMENGGFFWDGYQIGGRYTGFLDGYDPTKDERNIENCDRCDGTGKQVKWPTCWAPHEGDVMPIEKLTEEHLKKFYRLVLPDHHGTRWAEGDSEQEMPPVEWLKKTFAKHFCVVVDNHE
jgi:hypothetical protein